MGLVRRSSAYVLAYLLWIISVGMCAYFFFRAREAILSGLALTATNPDLTDSQLFYKSLQIRAIDQWSWVVIGMVLIVLLILLEALYRTGVPNGRLWPRFGMVMAILFLLLVIVDVALTMQIASFGQLPRGNLFVLFAELILGVGFLGLWLYTRNRQPRVNNNQPLR